jgi:hypothetical protein
VGLEGLDLGDLGFGLVGCELQLGFYALALDVGPGD